MNVFQPMRRPDQQYADQSSSINIGKVKEEFEYGGFKVNDKVLRNEELNAKTIKI